MTKSETCLECMYCCEYVHIPLEQGNYLMSFYRDTRGLDIRFDGFVPWLVLKSPCQHLTKQGCRIYKNRPIHCQCFDGRKLKFDKEKCQWKEEDQ